MGKYQEITSKITVCIAFVLFICFGAFCWDINERATDAKLNQYYAERTSTEDSILIDPIPIYAGCSKTKVYHIIKDFNCYKKIDQDNRIIFLSRDEAIEAGYKPCEVCKP